MTRVYLWSKSAPRAELDQRAREARLRLEQVQRLLVARAPAAASRLERVFRIVGSGIFAGTGIFAGRARRIAADRRSRTTPEIAEVAILTFSSRNPSRSGGSAARRPAGPETLVARRLRRTTPAGPKAPPAGFGRLRAC